MNVWSEGEMKTHFLKHDGYIGAIGLFLINLVDDHGVEQLHDEAKTLFKKDNILKYRY